jgi:biopolymer transport protein ExbB/TolQ
MSTTPTPRRKRKGLLGIVIGVLLTVLGPLVGLLVTVFSLHGAFDGVKGPSVAPENKARTLADGISHSMTATAIGVAVGIVGIIVLVASIVAAVRANRR